MSKPKKKKPQKEKTDEIIDDDAFLDSIIGK